MSRHDVQFYWDGRLKVEFCCNCGLEETELRETYSCEASPCEPIEINDQLSFDFSVDNKSEQS